MPYSATINDFYWDFGNGYVPFFAVIGAYNIFMYGDNVVGGATAMVPSAIASFDEMGVLNPIGNQTMYYDDISTFDVSDLFGHPTGEPITVTVDGNSNTDIVDAVIDGDILTLTAQDISGTSEINLLGVGGTLSCSYDFNVIVSNPLDQFVIILDLDPTPTGSILQASIENFYTMGDVHVTNDISAFPLNNADAVFVLLGIYSSNTTLSETEAGPLASYLDGGGNVYMEGGDTWYYDSATSVHPYFNITGLADGTSDLSTVNGSEFLDGMTWNYTGENSYIDHLAPIGSAVTIFSNPSPAYNCGIAYDEGTYKTVGSSFEITGLGGTNSLDDAVCGIIDFFGIAGVPLAPPTNLAVNEATGLFTWDAPVVDELTGYDVYLDSVFQVNTTDLEWQFTDLVNGTTYEAGVIAVYDEGSSVMTTIEFIPNIVNAGNDIVATTTLNGNYPNPFNPVTSIAYSIKEAGNVILEVHNIKGQLVITLVNEVKETGNYTITWDGTDNSNKSVSSGVYFYKMKSGNYTATKKMILMK